VVAPFGHLFFTGIDVTFLALAAMAVLLLMRHRGNIAKLRAGTERKIGQKSAAAPASARRGSH
jgi:glycerol-3-phosphate acyltransferase PlsY